MRWQRRHPKEEDDSQQTDRVWGGRFFSKATRRNSPCGAARRRIISCACTPKSGDQMRRAAGVLNTINLTTMKADPSTPDDETMDDISVQVHAVQTALVSDEDFDIVIGAGGKELDLMSGEDSIDVAIQALQTLHRTSHALPLCTRNVFSRVAQN